MKHSTLTLGDAGGNFPFCSKALRPRGQSQMFFLGGPTMSYMPECQCWCQLSMVTFSKTCKCVFVCMHELVKYCYVRKAS